MPRSPPQPYSSWEECVVSGDSLPILNSQDLDECSLEPVGQTEQMLMLLHFPQGHTFFAKEIDMRDEHREKKWHRIYMEGLTSMLVESCETKVAPKFYGVYFFRSHRNYITSCLMVFEYLQGARDLRDCLGCHYQNLVNPVNIIPLIKMILLRVLHHLKQLHGIGLVHRDIKSDNIMVRGTVESESTLEVFLIDFGMCEWIEEMFDEESDYGLGTAHYFPPEAICPYPVMLNEFSPRRLFDPDQLPKHGQKILPSFDVFSLGVLLFEMLHPQGYTPFETTRQESCEELANLRKQNMLWKNGEFCRECTYQDACFLKVVPWAYDLYLRLTAPNPDQRLTVNEAIQHPFFREERLSKPLLLWTFKDLASIAQTFHPEYKISANTPLNHDWSK